MRAARYRHGGSVKPVNTAGGLTMLKPQASGKPSAEMAEVHGALSKQRLDKRARGGGVGPVTAREKSEIGAKSGGRKWIAGAIKHPGALSASAKKAGMSPMAFASKHKHDSGKTGQRARLALMLRGFHKK